MSYKVAVTFRCDHPYCDEYYYTEHLNHGGMNMSYASYLARRDGWQVNGTRALCPTHKRTR